MGDAVGVGVGDAVGIGVGETLGIFVGASVVGETVGVVVRTQPKTVWTAD